MSRQYLVLYMAIQLTQKLIDWDRREIDHRSCFRVQRYRGHARQKATDLHGYDCALYPRHRAVMYTDRIFRIVGANIQTSFGPECSHLVHSSFDTGDEAANDNPKIAVARVRGTPVVGWKWLLELGKKMALAKSEKEERNEAEARRLAKGKGKEMTEVDQSTDITNGRRMLSFHSLLALRAS